MISRLQPFLEPALIYGIGTLGLALIYRYLRFPDFTVIGSIVVGGVTTVFFSNSLGFGAGILLGCLSGVGLGLCTGILSTKLKIKPVLSGIISFTASLTVAHLLTLGGRIDLKEIPERLLTSVYSPRDLLFLSACALLICFLLASISATKFGVLVLAMTANPKYLRFRHRHRNGVFIAVAATGNGIVALAGGLHAIRDTAANVQAHYDFLPLSLGGIFAANAVTIWASRFIGEYELVADAHGEVRGGSVSSRLKHNLARLFWVESHNSKQLFLLFLAYVVGCFSFTLISRSVQAQVFFSINSAYHHVIVAVLMAFFVFWAGTGDEA